MKFGDWNITVTAIEWAGPGLNRFVIGKHSLLETTRLEDEEGDMYKWIILATEEEWLSHDELYDLNFAFVFAAGASAGDFNYEIFDRTLEYQFDVLDEDEESEPDDQE